MYAYFFSAAARRVRVWQEEIQGMPLLRLEIPRTLRARTCRRILRWLTRCGVHEILNLPEHWPEQFPLPPLNATRSLWLAQAPSVAKAWMACADIPAGQAAVLFHAAAFSPEIAAVAWAIAPIVRTMYFSCPIPEDFCWQMQRDWGISPCQSGGADALIFAFAPVQGAFVLPLWCPRPEPLQLRLTCPRLSLPPGCPELPLLAALHQQGRLRGEEIEVRADFS